MSDQQLQLGERIAKMEGLLESHEKNAVERRVELNKKFDVIFGKFDLQNCAAHKAKMDTIEKEQEAIRSEYDGRLRFLEKAYWAGVGALTVMIFAVKFFWR